MDETDEQLALAACAGDREAFRRLVHRHQAPVAGLLLGLCREAAAAENAAKEAFSRALRELSSFEPRSSFRTWIARLALKAARPRRGRRGWKALEALSPFPMPEGLQRRIALERDMEGLSWRQRQILGLRLEGYGPGEIAQVLVSGEALAVSELGAAVRRLGGLERRGNTGPDCRIMESLWACWPALDAAPAEAGLHAAACPPCADELEKFRHLCCRATGADRRPLAFHAMADKVWLARLAESNCAAISGSRPRVPSWVPALLCAAAALLVFGFWKRHAKPVPASANPAPVADSSVARRRARSPAAAFRLRSGLGRTRPR
ncbi:MAG: hypothetical protein HY921_03755 [Elusimicrobia bacterium]|nr:hypothetical protein [Elusimicrobiota bacterium]